MRFLSRLRSLRQEEQITINTAKLRARQEQQLSLLQGHTQNIELSFLNSKIEELVKIKNQKVFNSFSTRCLNPQIRALNALADVNIERVFDKKAQNKVPFTVKDHLKVEGMIETCGFADNLKPSIVSSEVVQLLQAQNCIAFAHSNVPQGLLGIQSNNSVFGLCRNPHNSNFVSGGSSGGEAVLVASKATSFGVGSDSGGSARIPAAFCGVYGFKPTGSKRLSVKGRVGPSGVQGVKLGGVDSSFGFITRNFDDIVWLCAKTLGRKVQKEVTQLYGGLWDESRFQAAKRKKLKIGYLYENQEMKTAPGIKNSINQTLQLLKSQGHHVAQFKFPKLHHFRNFFFEFVYQTGFLKALAQRTKGHIPSPQAQDFYLIGSEGLAGVPQQLKQEQVLKDMHRIYSREQSTWQFFRIHREVGDLKEQFLKQWKAQELDILITPVMPFTAPLPGTSDLLVYQLTYCSFQNVLELPAGSIPTRLVNQSQTHYEPSNAYEKRVAESIKQSKGLPIGIQVTGSHLQDEECLGAMWQIQKLVGNYIQPSFLRSKN